MLPHRSTLLLIASLLGPVAMPSMAGSSASSAASDSVTTSVGSLSDSVKGSSNSSKTTVAEGDYRIIEVADAPDRPGMMRMTLQSVADPGEGGQVVLLLPQGVVQQGRLAQGQQVGARRRPYGFEFVQGPERKAFFLVLEDDWYRELQTRAVVL